LPTEPTDAAVKVHVKTLGHCPSNVQPYEACDVTGKCSAVARKVDGTD
jgi:hypothetical protein